MIKKQKINNIFFFFDIGNGFRPVINATTSCQEDDPEMILYRMPIFAFVTFNLEVQQQFVIENYDQKDSGIWKTLGKVFFKTKKIIFGKFF